MKQTIQISSLVFTSLLLLSLLAGCGSNQAGQEPIKIGAILILTGDVANIGQALRQGIELAVDEINAQGGFKGKPLQAVVEDDRLFVGGPVGAVTAAEKLISEDHIVAGLVTAVNDAKPASPTFETNKVPLVTLWDSNQELENLGDYTFGIGFSTERDGELFAEYAFNKLHIKKIGTGYHIDEWSQLFHKHFIQRFKELGGEIIEGGSYAAEEKDYRTLITKLMQNKVEGIFFPFIMNGDLLLKQIKELGYKGKVLTGDVVTKELLENTGDAIEGVYYTQVFAEKNPKLDHVIELYKQKYKEEAPLLVFTALGYDSVYTLFEAMKQAGSAQPEAIKTALYKIKGLQGATGTITFNEKGSAPKEERVWHIEQGKEVLVT